MWYNYCYDCSEDEVVNSLDDIYDVGTFVQITEMAEQGDRLRMIIQGIRRYSHMCKHIVRPFIMFISEFK